MQPFLVPADFRAFMKQVVTYLDASSDEPKFLDAEDALQDETGYGGRIDGVDQYKFTYIASDGMHKWELPLAESAIREIADGLLIEVAAERFEIVRTKHRDPAGSPLLIWGEYGDDALSARDEGELLRALDSLHALAQGAPRMLRMWSASDDQIVAMVWRDDCALYIVEAADGYSTSCGDSRRQDAFEMADHDGRPMVVPYADCVSWSIARNALLRFGVRGELGPELRTEGRIPTGLLMMGDVDRKSALAVRAEPARIHARSSLPRMLTPVPPPEHETLDDDDVPTPLESEPPPGLVPLTGEELAGWARRLIELLASRELVELGHGNLDEITYQLTGLLQAHGDEAEHSLDTADWLANEIGAVRGIHKLFATGGDLQIALRRSRAA